MNPLSEILSDLKIQGSVYFCDYLNPPWDMVHTQEPRAMFHLVRRGRCFLSIEGNRYELVSGDFVYVSPGVDHRVTSAEGDKLDSLLLCGFSTFEADKNDLLVRDIPEYIVLRNETLQDYQWLRRTLEHLSAEYMSDQPSVEITINKLTEILIIQLLRSEFGGDNNVGIVAAMRNKKLAKALTEIHSDLSKPWTVEAAATQASMSRSGFSKLFSETVNISFFEYITQVRVKRAKRLLEASKFSVAEIAEQVGYQSELSFIKVFKKAAQMTPRAYRISKA